MSIADKLSRIAAAVDSLSVSIRGKGVSVPDGTGIEAFPALVDSIQTGGGSDIEPTEAMTFGGLVPSGSESVLFGKHVSLTATFESAHLFNPGSIITLKASAGQFGDAAPSDVTKGKTFTAVDGLLQVGTAQSDWESDAGVSFDVNGLTPTQTETETGAKELTLHTYTQGILHLYERSLVALRASMDKFGDATAADVAAGKTFTSAAGLLSVGTAQLGNDGGSGGGSNLPDTIVAGDTPVMACFEGQSISATTPTATTLTLTIPRAGTYRFKASASAGAGNGSSATVYLYKNEQSVASSDVSRGGFHNMICDIGCLAGDIITVYGKAGAGSYGINLNANCAALIACINWDNGF